ncbi:MAG: DUF6356 family protein [Pseudomonadota bacterium]
MEAVTRLFTSHPQSVDETYIQHLFFAAKFSGLLFLAGGAALVHALFPFLCERTASRIVGTLYARTHERGAE